MESEKLEQNISQLKTANLELKKDIDKKYGIVVENSEKGVYNGMKKFLDNYNEFKNGYIDKKTKIEKFNPEKFNEEIKNKVKDIIG